MEFTGERYLPDMGGELRMEHVHRYAFCLPYVKNKVVLDAACGEGYGSALLASVAASVVGVDVSDGAVGHARDRYASLGERLRFDLGDATALTLPDAHFDVVVSFETIEHVFQQEAMMAGFRRVLKRGGLLILSSPDKRTYSDEPGFHNEFHVKELYLDELRSMVGRHFKRHVLLGQRLTGGSAIFVVGNDQAAKEARPLLLTDDGQKPAERGPRLADPVYLMVMATNGSTLPAPHPSVLLTEQDDPLQALRRIARWASGVDTEMKDLRLTANAELQRLREALDAEKSCAALLESRAAEASALAASVQAKADAAEDQLRHAKCEHEQALTDLATQHEAANTAFRASEQRHALAMSEHLTQLDMLRAHLESMQRGRDVERVHHTKQIEGLQALQQTQIEALHADVAKHVTQLEVLRAQLENTQNGRDAESAQHAAQLEGLQSQHHSQVDALQADVGRLLEHKQALHVRVAHLESAEASWAEERKARAAEAEGLLAELAQLAQLREQLALQFQDLSAQREDRAAAQAAWHSEQLQLSSQLAALRAEQCATQAAAVAAAEVAARREASREADWALRLSTQAVDWESRQAALQARLERDHERAARLWAERQTATESLVDRLRLDSAEALQRADDEAQALRHDADADIERWRLDLTESRRQLQHTQLALHRQADLAAQTLRRQQEQAQQERALLQSTNRTVQQSVAALAQAIGGELESLRLTVTPRQRTAHQAVLALQRTQEGLHSALQAATDALPTAGARAIAAAPRTLVALMGLDDLAFLREAYRCVLHRDLDSDGQDHYLRRLRQGEQRLRVLADLRLSSEGQQQPTKLDGLDDAIRSLRKSRIPLLGNSERLRLQTWLTSQPARTAAVDQAAPATAPLTRIESALDDLQRGSALLAEAVPIAVALGRAPREFGLDPWACAQELVRADSQAFVDLAYALLCQRAPSASEAQRERARMEVGTSRVYILNLLLDQSEPVPATGGDAAPLPRSLAVLSLGARTQMPVHELPVVSVIVVTQGRVDGTLRCLRSMLRHPPTTPFEVIVVDDASPDSGASVLASISGLRVVALDTPSGQAACCQAGAKSARGDFLHFLHGNCEVQAGWLDELHATFDLFPGTGMAGSQLLRPDGRLQAAGCVVWQDGTVSPLGHGEDATQSHWGHAREVDACSAGSLMVPAHLYEAVGGMAVETAGMEGADLALALAARGYRAMLQPLSRVVQAHTVSKDHADAPGEAADAAGLPSPLLARWGTALQTYPQVGTPPDQAARHRLCGRLLAVEHRLPRPDRDAGSVSVFNMLMAAREQGLHVSLLAEADVAEGNDADQRHVQMLQRSGVEVLLAPQTRSLQEHIETHGHNLDIVLMYRPVVMERHAPVVQRLCPKAKLIYYPHDLHFLRLARQAAVTRDAALAAEAERRKEHELALQASADLTLVASQVELQLLTDAGLGAKTRWLPLLLDTTRIDQPAALRKGMVFIGGFHHAPNIDAVRQLVEDIMPRVRATRPDIAVWVVGEAPPPDLAARQDPGVHFLGAVDDLTELFASVRLAIAPIRFGAGAKGKVARPMAAGLPVVASPEASEGMGLTGDEQLLIADNADAFAAAVIRLHDDNALWRRLSDAGHLYAADHWGPKAAALQMGQIIQSLGLGTRKSPFATRFFNEARHLRLAPSNKPTSPDQRLQHIAP